MFRAVVFTVRIPSCFDRSELFWCGALFRNDLLYAVILPLRTEKAVRRSFERYASAADISYVQNFRSGFQKKVRAYFSGERPLFNEKLDLSGIPDFSRRVLSVVRNIPYGRTLSYSLVAERARSVRAVRAIGSIMAHNRLPLIVPCHRVVKKSGAMGGFSAGMGIHLKKIMLAIESGCDH